MGSTDYLYTPNAESDDSLEQIYALMLTIKNELLSFPETKVVLCGTAVCCAALDLGVLGTGFKFWGALIRAINSPKYGRLWQSMWRGESRRSNITPTNIYNKITHTYPEFETSCFIKLKNTTKVPIKPYFELTVSVANSGRSLKRECAGDVLLGVPSATADFAHVVVDRGNTTGLTPSPARGPRPVRPFLSQEKRI